ncbi:MAG: DUF1464 family protein [bacterium]
MARVVGIDPGSISFDLCGWEQGRVFLDQSVPSDQVADRAESILEMITASGPVDLILRSVRIRFASDRCSRHW